MRERYRSVLSVNRPVSVEAKRWLEMGSEIMTEVSAHPLWQRWMADTAADRILSGGAATPDWARQREVVETIRLELKDRIDEIVVKYYPQRTGVPRPHQMLGEFEEARKTFNVRLEPVNPPQRD